MTLNNPITDVQQGLADLAEDRRKKQADRYYFWNDVGNDIGEAASKVKNLFGGSSSGRPASNNSLDPAQGGGSGYGNQPPYSQSGYTNAGPSHNGQYQNSQPGFVSSPGAPVSGYGQGSYQQGPPQSTFGPYSQQDPAQLVNYQAPPQQPPYDLSVYGNRWPQQSFHSTGQPYDPQSNYSAAASQQQGYPNHAHGGQKPQQSYANTAQSFGTYQGTSDGLDANGQPLAGQRRPSNQPLYSQQSTQPPYNSQ